MRFAWPGAGRRGLPGRVCYCTRRFAPVRARSRTMSRRAQNQPALQPHMRALLALVALLLCVL